MRLAFFLGAAVSLAIWLAGAELEVPARALMSLLVGLLPALAMLQANAMAGTAELPTRLQLYGSTILSLWVLALAAVLAGNASGFTAELLGLRPLPWPSFLVWLAFSMAAVAAVVLGFKAFGVRESPVVEHLIPESRSEKYVYIVVAFTAGICEEIVFRGFLIAALTVTTGSPAFAIAVAAGAFGVAHAHQHAGGAMRAALLALVLSIPLVMSGSLYPGIAAHVIVDLLGGLWLFRWLLRS